MLLLLSLTPSTHNMHNLNKAAGSSQECKCYINKAILLVRELLKTFVSLNLPIFSEPLSQKELKVSEHWGKNATLALV